jgi:ribosomal-protein-alanine N-acetyltransferase
MQLKPLDKSHIDGIMEIENESFAIPWSRASVEKELNNKLAIYLVATEGDKVIGYGGMWHVVTEGYITNIAVHKDYRRQGVGDAIVKGLIKIADDKEMIGVTLEVRVSNKAAIELYRRNGFVFSGVRKEYYEDNKEDAFIMWHYLIPPDQIEHLS